MPPSKKRGNQFESSSADSSKHFAKGARTDDGGRRGVAAPSFAFGASQSASSPPKSSITRQAKKRATRSNAKDKYLKGMAQLNYQAYKIAQDTLADPDSVPNDAFYSGFVENYTHQASELKRRHGREHGDIIVFGDGDCGQLGCGETVTESRKPRIVVGLRGKEIDMVASGGLHSLAIDRSGAVHSWGCPDEGSLGWLATEEKQDGAVPDRIRGFYPSEFGPNGRTEEMVDGNGRLIPFKQREEAVITQVATGETQSLALSAAGDVYMWGTYKDNEGRKFRNMPPEDDKRTPTGNKDMAKLEEDDNPVYYHPPRGNQDWPEHLVEMPKKAKDISSGGGFNAALLEDDTIVTWGIGTCGDLARPVPELKKSTPDTVVLEDFLKPKPPIWAGPPLKRTVVAISCGGMHLLAITKEEGELCVYSSGLNNYGQLGHGDLKNREELTKVQFFNGKDITKVEGGYQFSCFVDKTGKELFTCGRGDYGSLGISLEQPDAGYLENLPCRTPLVYEPRGTVANPKENCIVVDDIVEEDQPEIEQVSCGSTHALVLVKGGDAYSWGFGTSGACGQGASDDDVLRPTKLEMKKSKIRYVSGGGQHSTAIVTTNS